MYTDNWEMALPVTDIVQEAVGLMYRETVCRNMKYAQVYGTTAML